MKKEDRNNRIKLIMEKYCPLFFSSIFTVFCIIQSSTFTLRDDIMAAVNAVLVAASILIGFVGVLVGLIFTQSENEILREVFGDKNLLNLLKKYFMSVYKSGFLLLIACIGIFFQKSLYEIISIKILGENLTIDVVVKYFWIFILLYFALSTYRLIKIVVELIFHQPGIKEDKEDKNEDYSELEDRHSK